MAKVSGYGGYWVVSQDEDVIQHNAEYSLEIQGECRDCLPSGNGGWVQGLPIACKFESGVIKIPEDDAAYPEAIGLTENTVLAIWFKRGADERYDQVVNTIVTSVRYSNHQQKARVIEIRIAYGTFARFVEGPDL